jgi:hypothetical protein
MPLIFTLPAKFLLCGMTTTICLAIFSAAQGKSVDYQYFPFSPNDIGWPERFLRPFLQQSPEIPSDAE